MEFKRISNYDIHIRHTVNGGVIAKVGCAELSFSSPEDMMDVMKQYYEDPEGIEKLYNQSGANHDVPQEVAYSDGEGRGPTVSGGNRLSRGPLNVEETTNGRR